MCHRRGGSPGIGRGVQRGREDGKREREREREKEGEGDFMRGTERPSRKSRRHPHTPTSLSSFFSFLSIVPPHPSLARLKKQAAREKHNKKPDIGAWLANAAPTSPIDDDMDDDRSKSWDRDALFDDWPRSLQFAHNNLLTSSTKLRVEFLNGELLPLAKAGNMNLSQTMDVFKLLVETYPRYVDTASRDAVEDVGMALVAHDQSLPQQDRLGVADHVLSWLANETSQISKRGAPSAYAPANIFVLLSWCSALYSTLLRSDPSYPTASQGWIPLVVSLAALLDLQLTRGTRTKPSMRRAALVRTRRALRTSPPALSVLISTLVRQAKGSQGPAGLVQIPLLGTAVDVSVRLKTGDAGLRTISEENKNDILALYTSTVVMAKTPVPPHASSVLHDFIQHAVTPADLETTVLPAMEKALLRSPEHALSVVTDFFTAYPHPLPAPVFSKLVAAALASAKSTNALARAGAVALFGTIASSACAPQDADGGGDDEGGRAMLLEKAAADILAAPKAGKTAGAEHRAALYAMLGAIPPLANANSESKSGGAGAGASREIVRAAPGLVAKETSEPVMRVLAGALGVHLGCVLSEAVDDVEGARGAAAALGKEIAGSGSSGSAGAGSSAGAKAGVRRACVGAVGTAIWGSPSVSPVAEGKKKKNLGGDGEGNGDAAEQKTEAAVKEKEKSVLGTAAGAEFARGLVGAFEGALKSVSASPLAAPAGPLEGYVGVACVLGPMRDSGRFDDVIKKLIPVDMLVGTQAKPGFLVWDKVYGKLTDPVEEEWLVRAAGVALEYLAVELGKNEGLRIQFGALLTHLTVHTPHAFVRRAALKMLVRLVRRHPALVNRVVRESVVASLTTPPKEAKEKARSPASASAAAGAKGKERDADEGAEGEKKGQGAAEKQKRYAALVVALAEVSAGVAGGDTEGREKVERAMVDLLVLAHHRAICGASSTAHLLWIDLLRHAALDPASLVAGHAEALVHAVVQATMLDPKYGFDAAGYAALSTLAFVCPAEVLPRVMQQLREDLEPAKLRALSEEDVGMWRTQEGVLYVDVLSQQKDEPSAPRKGKDADIARWEADLRKSISSKKSAASSSSPALSKQAQALVQAQLEKEAAVRARVASVVLGLKRGLASVRALVSLDIPELAEYVEGIVGLLSEGAMEVGPGLVGGEVFETYLELSKAASPRLDTLRTWVGVASLRCLKPACVPEDMQAEPLNSLLIRVLYRLRSLSEQKPFDAATFCYTFPLLAHIMRVGGIGGASENEKDAEDERLEQVTLVLDVLRFHASEFSDKAFPRRDTLLRLLDVIRFQPRLSKDASSILTDLGQAVQATASQEEVMVLVNGTLYQEVYVRNSCLQALQLWIACHDEDDQNARLANHVWDDNGLDVPEAFLDQLLPYLDHDHAYVRASTGLAIAEAVELHPQSIDGALKTLQEFYRDKARILAPEYDQYGMVIAQSLDRADPWLTRVAISKTLEHLAPSFTPDQVEPFFVFLIKDEALGDRTPEVRRSMLQAGTAIIDQHGADRLAGLLKTFEEHLGGPSPANETGDQIKEAVVILFGRLARHLDASDERIPSIVDRLVEALKTPSEQVQMAVSECLTPLVALMRPRAKALVDHLFTELFDAPRYAARRGAAYGLAGAIKGLGIGAMKEFDVINRLKAAAEDKKRFEPRQGTTFAFETLSTTLGRLFEPYITFILPLLLSAFGDSTGDVREAAQDAARVIMANMSAFGVKQILPLLLSGLDEKQWRSKKGSIELLGMMAYCSPRQLSLSLPIVIPRLTGVLTDTHAQVKVSANKSLKQFGEVITNPEIQSLVPILLKALVDPGKTSNALGSLLKTSFMHYIDHSSLALVIPIIERGLRERGADTKKKAAQIVGNLASLTDSKDFVPYLNTLLPMVHIVLVDPVPEARATAAKTLGTLVERLGEIHFPDLVPGLLRTLKTDTSGVDRQGAAQGLSEVLAGLGMERLEALLPDIIANAQSPRSTVKEGFMSLLVFLPATFGTRFQPHLPKIIAPILGGLSDQEESVREAAMRAGRMVVTNYSNKAIDLLLPELEAGMFDPGWRIRQSSITLVGELLFKVSGISGKNEIDEDEEGGEAADAAHAESSRRALIEVLGAERRDRILSALYLARQDTVNVVRQSSIHIWKALVHNTPRTVREILRELVAQVVRLSSSDEFEQQETATRTTTELTRKFGEKILGEIISILKNMSTSSDSRTRTGVCLMMCDVMENSTDNQRDGHESTIVSIVRSSLVDDDASVRTAAAKAFDTLQEHLGGRAIDQTIPTLLEALRQPGESSGTALQALKEVMSVRASTVFPVLIPTLIATPMTVFNAHALASLVTVAGNALSKRLTVLLNALAKVLEEEKDEEVVEAVEEALNSLLESIEDAEGLNTLMLLLLGWAKHASPKRRISACNIFATFCEVSELDSSLYRVDWVRQLISLFDDPVVDVHTAAWKSFDAFVKSVPKDEVEPLVVPLRRTIDSTGGPGRNVPGFSLPKGVAPTVPIIIAGLTTGNNEQRENAAYAIGELVQRTEEAAMKPFVVPFTGPLIRVATQAATYPPAVKTAILSALQSMLLRIPVHVKPFFPQLQRTFVKSVGDASSTVVRTRGAEALGVLMRNQPRVDPVVTELLAGAKGSDDEIASSFVLALSYVVHSSTIHGGIGEKAKESCAELVTDAFRESHGDHYNQALGGLVAALAQYPDILGPVVKANLVSGTLQSPLSSNVILAVISSDEEHSYAPEADDNLFQKLGVLKDVALKVKESATNERPIIARPAREARDILKAWSAHDESLAGLF
ncbi:ARM repeat-containing protein [Coniophora puteana RWD-64-598 SS2]|uniref:ARM repeat-containing protein n=1 Tax=Coniophora puteana (strain RWD-64-598) TaxID=741705 RepID=A0A5M3MMD5_CONPW|nr:ARM repeat-containing protein [Coniophora puteana RWD-64-598 SS2]EIW80197.1 ARM repeat-containing protein [Coniophora puteana RWD-64-598 SS2]